MRPIGILGGTFDPVHFGHLRPALELLETLGLAEVRLIPCGQPPHRSPPRAAAAARLAMLELALAGQPGLRVDTRELERPGPSYMVDTLASLRAELGPTPLCLLLGTDALLGLPGWHRWQELVQLAHLVVMHRPGWELSAAPAPLAQLLAAQRVQDPAALTAQPAGAILFQPVTQLEISATAIRAMIAAGHSPRYLLPEAVWEWIRANELYT
ncbi:MAG: nicotinic acid mononucleotide adenylyltransferase [Gammaproteobacteria bacterium HGW-Gammaproteobacteria-1]|jgi:nicotinate-nucleotide adenylyltransferase|nr:MAG: nicotinic acid mononucleotide adenylyltransferase [Gammaproteobacteria bacterium HGW-Gammaproteobacteria-1]